MKNLSTCLSNVSTEYNKSVSNPLSEARAWDVCHNEFLKALGSPDPDTDRLALHLGMYLSNWGMYRGSAFVRNYNYREFIPIVDFVLDSKYRDLSDVEITAYADHADGARYMALLFDLVEKMRGYLKDLRDQVDSTIKSDISQTLITKILLVTLGCVPAYDQYFSDGVKKDKTASGTFNKKSVLQLAQFYCDNMAALETCRKELINLEDNATQYPQAKLVDMIFFGIGFGS